VSIAASHAAFVKPKKAILFGETPLSKAFLTTFFIKVVVLPVPGGPNIL